ncbi:MAG: tripartite tricarboxylate transporter substrate binding protein [Betaproteobacteria bacterium]|nr:tripartite tricarboxylate transporter substrate binding protein [Betaproteobacteria bacterium]MBV9362561.1 tripartite tricarboxylate transporter substrate binding protein [Betaproteobacteria bacterium]
MRWASFLLCFFAAQVLAQDYPNHPVRIIVPSPPAGGTDIVGRVLAEHFTKALGQQFFVENKPGAGNLIGIETAARSAPDGYTLLMAPSTIVLNTVLYKKVPFDPVKDFAPITLTATAPNILIVNPSVPVKTTAELIALAKQKPGTLNYGTPGIGTSPHLCMELLKYMAGIDIQHVPYRGTAAVVTDVMSGQIAVAFATALTAKPQVDAGRVRALAVSGPRRVEAMPNVPPVADAVPGYEAMQWYGLLAAAGTPAPVIERLNGEAKKALVSEEMKKRLAADGAEPLSSTPAEFAAFIRRELEKWRKVIEVAKIEKQ